MSGLKVKNPQAKMRELILYISEQLSDDPKFGSTKLNKVLFFADFLHYRNKGESITGQEYWKLANGPAPRCFIPLRQEMIKEGIFDILPRDYWGEIQQVPTAKRKSNLSAFTGYEIALVDHVIEKLKPCDANECSNKSHNYLGLLWDLIELKETIPYNIALVTRADDDTKEQMDYCDEMQRRAEKWLMAMN
ncbi:MAG: Panacea domain-containing protein [Bacilli bacterium]